MSLNLRILSVLLFAAGTLWAAEKAVTIADVMNRLTILHNRSEAVFLNHDDVKNLPGLLDGMDGLYAGLSEAYEPVYGGSEAAWKGYCEESRAVLRETKEALGRDDGKAAYSSFLRLSVIREKAHEDFQPGLLKRLSRYFKKKSKEKNR